VPIGTQASSISLFRILLDSLLAPFTCAWHNYELLKALVRRDIQARFRDTVFGFFWAVAAPLVKLGVYTAIFGALIQPRWQTQVSDPHVIAFTYFSSLIFVEFLIECLNASSNMIRDNTTYIKKVVFPVEILPWIALGYATFRVLVGMTLVLIAYLGLIGLPPVDVLVIPLLFVFFALTVLGLMWVLAALAVYVRDVGHVVTAFLPIIMFISPVFFPLSAVPEPAATLLMINPLTFPLEQMRMALFGNGFHAWVGFALYGIVAILVASLGYRFFLKVRPGFADVL
jgi:lipopolysaccharide transport system permease protein